MATLAKQQLDAAFASAFEAERAGVMRLACSIVGDVEVAKDLAADAFARTYEQWSRGRVDNVPAYVRRTVINHAHDYFRRLERRRRQEGRRSGDGRASSSLADDAEARDSARRMLLDLPPRQRAALVLRYWADLTDAGVAEALGVPLGTAKSLLRRGIAGLRITTARTGDNAAGPHARAEGTRTRYDTA
jgi:RNA polymerase sigma factor (sigma-70 family)